MRLTKRGEMAFKVLLIVSAGSLAWGIWEVIAHLWWTGTGYCWGDMYECTKGGLL